MWWQRTLFELTVDLDSIVWRWRVNSNHKSCCCCFWSEQYIWGSFKSESENPESRKWIIYILSQFPCLSVIYPIPLPFESHFQYISRLVFPFIHLEAAVLKSDRRICRRSELEHPLPLSAPCSTDHWKSQSASHQPICRDVKITFHRPFPWLSRVTKTHSFFTSSLQYSCLVYAHPHLRSPSHLVHYGHTLVRVSRLSIPSVNDSSHVTRFMYYAVRAKILRNIERMHEEVQGRGSWSFLSLRNKLLIPFKEDLSRIWTIIELPASSLFYFPCSELIEWLLRKILTPKVHEWIFVQKCSFRFLNVLQFEATYNHLSGGYSHYCNSFPVWSEKQVIQVKCTMIHTVVIIYFKCCNASNITLSNIKSYSSAKCFCSRSPQHAEHIVTFNNKSE